MKNNLTAIAAAMFALAIILYIGAANPLAESLNRARATLSQEEVRLCAAQISIAQSSDIKAKILALEKSNAQLSATLISPLLNSYAMRAKSLIAERAIEAGLQNIEYEEGDYRALPIPKEQMPTRRTGRHSVKIRAQGDYAAIVSFILRAEKELPLMTVQALSITPSKNSADIQDAEVIVEWPCEGKVIQ